MDKRIEKTDKALQETLLSLLKEKDIEEITVKEICEKAMTSRITFYAHYRDKYELLYNIIQILGERIYEESKKDRVQELNSFDLPHLFTKITINVIELCQKQKEVITKIYYSEGIGKTIILSSCNEMIKNLFEIISSDEKKINKNRMDFMFSFLIGGLNNFIIDLLKQEKEIDFNNLYNEFFFVYKFIVDRLYTN